MALTFFINLNARIVVIPGTNLTMILLMIERPDSFMNYVNALTSLTPLKLNPEHGMCAGEQRAKDLYGTVKLT